MGERSRAESKAQSSLLLTRTRKVIKIILFLSVLFSRNDRANEFIHRFDDKLLNPFPDNRMSRVCATLPAVLSEQIWRRSLHPDRFNKFSNGSPSPWITLANNRSWFKLYNSDIRGITVMPAFINFSLSYGRIFL